MITCLLGIIFRHVDDLRAFQKGGLPLFKIFRRNLLSGGPRGLFFPRIQFVSLDRPFFPRIFFDGTWKSDGGGLDFVVRVGGLIAQVVV